MNDIENIIEDIRKTANHLDMKSFDCDEPLSSQLHLQAENLRSKAFMLIGKSLAENSAQFQDFRNALNHHIRKLTQDIDALHDINTIAKTTANIFGILDNLMGILK